MVLVWLSERTEGGSHHHPRGHDQYIPREQRARASRQTCQKPVNTHWVRFATDDSRQSRSKAQDGDARSPDGADHRWVDPAALMRLSRSWKSARFDGRSAHSALGRESKRRKQNRTQRQSQRQIGTGTLVLAARGGFVLLFVSVFVVGVGNHQVDSGPTEVGPTIRVRTYRRSPACFPDGHRDERSSWLTGWTTSPAVEPRDAPAGLDAATTGSRAHAVRARCRHEPALLPGESTGLAAAREGRSSLRWPSVR